MSRTASIDSGRRRPAGAALIALLCLSALFIFSACSGPAGGEPTVAEPTLAPTEVASATPSPAPTSTPEPTLTPEATPTTPPELLSAQATAEAAATAGPAPADLPATPITAPTESGPTAAAETPAVLGGPPGVNGVSPEQIAVISPETAAHVREIWALGRQLGRSPQYYSKLGDSTAMTPHMLARFDEPGLNMGDYAYLQPTIDYYAGVFDEFGVATNYGLHSWSIFDPLWAPKEWCQPNEHVLECEFRLNNPSVLIIRLGSNDAGSPDGFRYNMRLAVQYALDNGVIPVLVTKADRFEGDDTNNTILREIAAEYQIPLWDFDRVATTIPGKGLDADGIHMVYYTANDYSDPAAFQSGHALQDLTGLIMLDTIRKIVTGESDGTGG